MSEADRRIHVLREAASLPADRSLLTFERAQPPASAGWLHLLPGESDIPTECISLPQILRARMEALAPPTGFLTLFVDTIAACARFESGAALPFNPRGDDPIPLARFVARQYHHVMEPLPVTRRTRSAA